MSNLVKYDPFAELLSLQRQFFGDDVFTNIQSSQIPTTDVYTDEDKKMVVEAHLPNFDEKDVDIHIDGEALVVRAERHEQEKDKKKKYIVRESSSSFYRRVNLPKMADKDNIDAHMKDGVLVISVPFKELPEPKKIAISKK